jgi:hypothetical protein
MTLLEKMLLVGVIAAGVVSFGLLVIAVYIVIYLQQQPPRAVPVAGGSTGGGRVSFHEIKARALYNWYCLIMVDGSWNMGAHLYGGVFPWSGCWVNERGTFKTLMEAHSAGGMGDN